VTKHLSIVRVWLVVAFLAMAAAMLLTYSSIRQSEISNISLDHTQRVLLALLDLEGHIADLVFASSAEAVTRASSAALTQLDGVSALTGDNEPQQQRLARLRLEIEGLTRTRRGSAMTGLVAPSQALVPESLARALREVRVSELQLLTSRVAISDRTSRRLRIILAVSVMASGPLLALVFGLVVRDEKKRRENERLLRGANEELDGRVLARTAALNEALERELTLRRQAEANSRLKDEFLMTVSHELRTPLNALLGWADMLRRGMLSDGRRQRAAEAIYENAKLQNQLIADLIDTSRILTGKLRIEPTMVDLGRIIRDAANVVAPAAEAKGLALDVALDWQPNVFVGDPGRLQQIVWNLVFNAVKFTKQGTVSVRLAPNESESQVDIIVADTGVGITRDFLPHVFDRFSQEKTGTTRPHGGLGLGLAIVRQLVELHGGTIRVESDGENQGSVFTVSLPLVPVRKALAAAPDTAVAPIVDENEMPGLDGIHVLVVDDDPSAREMVTVTLEHCGARVSAAGSAAEARMTTALTACDVMLIDIAMPGEDGYALIRDLRTRGLRQPIAALTALAHDTDRARALEAGFDVHISKPVEPRALALAVAAMARRTRAEVS
jgi:signal transduction histidine kinase/CheY-like chemotaxis protein